MSSEKCILCSQQSSFGFRPRNTLGNNLILGKKVCSCIISEKESIIRFLKWMKFHEISKDLTEKFLRNGEENYPNRKQVQKEISSIPHFDIVKKIENREVIRRIASYVSDTTNKLFEDISPWEYLDIGCGTGQISREIARSLCVMTQHTDVKDSRFGKYSFEDYEDFLIYDGVNLPYESEMYKIVTCFLVLHHVENPEGLLKSVYRILKPGGIFIIREFNCENWDMCYSLDLMHQITGEDVVDESPVTSYRSREKWRKLLSGVGFILLEDKCKNEKDCPYGRYFDVFQKPEINLMSHN